MTSDITIRETAGGEPMWSEPDRAAGVRQAAAAVARFAATSPELDVRPGVRRELLTKYVFWLVSIGTINNKYDTRYRSRAALKVRDPAKLVHEHVFPRAHLADLILANPTDDAINDAINQAFGCVVTREEHTRLSAFDKTHRGWERYHEAGIEVIDMATGQPFDTTPDVTTSSPEPRE